MRPGWRELSPEAQDLIHMMLKILMPKAEFKGNDAADALAIGIAIADEEGLAVTLGILHQVPAVPRHAALGSASTGSSGVRRNTRRA